MNFFTQIFETLELVIETVLIGGATYVATIFTGPVGGAIVAGAGHVTVETLPPFADSPTVVNEVVCKTAECVDAVATNMMYDRVFDLVTTWGLWAIGGVVVYTIVMVLWGKLGMSSMKEGKLKKERNKLMSMMFDMDSVKMDDINKK